MKLKKWLLLIGFFLLLSGCGQKEEESITPTAAETQYRKEDLFETADTKESIAIPEKTPQGSQDIPKETEKKEYLEKQENFEFVQYDSANRYSSADWEKNLNSLFCIDPDTGVVYFVNQNKDWYIYRLVNGEAELAVELPARELYVLNGKVYFILEGYDKYEFDELTEGDVYACTLADGSIEKIFSVESLEGEIYRMRPYEDGIAFYSRVDTGECATSIIAGKSYEVKKKESRFYYYCFADATLETDSYKRVLPGWGEYYLMWDVSETGAKTSLLSRTNHEKEQLSDSFPGYRSFVVENTVYWFTGIGFGTIDLLTGEQKIYDINAMFRELVPVHAAMMDEVKEKYSSSGHLWLLDGFTVTRDYVWLTILNSYVFRLNPVSGEAECYRLAGLNSKLGDLYTDGINLYATYAQIGEWKDKGTLVRICTEKTVGQDTLFDVPLLAVEPLTK